MWQFYHAKKAGVWERTSIALLMKLPPVAVLQWMKENRKEPDEGVYIDMVRNPDDRAILEYCLYRRNEPLIDFSLARYGYTANVLKRVYKRCDGGTRLAALENPNGSVHVITLDSFWNEASLLELKAFFRNPNLAGGLFTNLFLREHGFKDLTDERHLDLVTLCSKHPRLNKKYSSTILDGLDEYHYHKTFDAAWGLARTAPVTPVWANALDELLGGCLPPNGYENPNEAILRWNIPEDFKEGGHWFNRGPFFRLRSTLARLLDQEDLENHQDAALRMGFYRNFDPLRFTDLPAYFSRDGEEFVNAAMYNPKLWKTEKLRQSLSSFCWKCPDPSHRMEMPSDYKIAQKHFMSLQPDWFLEEVREDTHEEIDPTLEALATLQERIEKLEVALANYVKNIPSNAAWWVVMALLALHFFGKN